MTLTDAAVRNAKPGEKPVKLFDERGLFMIVTPTGGKWWRLKYEAPGSAGNCFVAPGWHPRANHSRKGLGRAR